MAVLPLTTQRTNYSPNGSGTGGTPGVLGSGGAWPSYWGQFATSGLSIQVVGSGVSGGIAFTRFRFFGTSTGGFFVGVVANGLAPAASAGQTWTGSLYMAFAGGSLSGVTVQTGLRTSALDYSTTKSLTGTLTRFTATGTLGASPLWVVASYNFLFSTGVALDFTIDIGGVQLEQLPAATDFMPNSTGGAINQGLGSFSNLGAVLTRSRKLSAAITAYGNAKADPHGGGRLLSTQRTNWLTNTDLAGVVIGTPGNTGTLNNIVSVPGGVTRSVVGSSFESGIRYFDIRLFGTTTDANGAYIDYNQVGGIAAAQGQTWTLSQYTRVISGSMTGISSTNLVLLEMNGAGIQVNFWVASVSPTGAALSTQRSTLTATLSRIETSSVFPRIAWAIPSGTTIDVTLRIGGLMFDRAATASEWFPTGASAGTRGLGMFADATATAARSRAIQAAAGTVAQMAATIHATRAVQVALVVSGTIAATVRRSRAMQAAATVSAAIVAVNGHAYTRALQAALSASGAVAATARRSRPVAAALRVAGTLYAFARGGTYVPAEYQFFAVPVRRDFAALADRRITGPELPAFTAKGVMDNARYSYDFTLALATGDTVLATPAPTVTEATGTLTIGAPVLLGSVVMARISGGVAGTIYRVVWTCATAAGDTLSRTTPIAVENR